MKATMKMYKTIHDFITNTFPNIQTDPQLDNKKGFFKVVLMSAVEFAFLLFLFPLTYEVSDDYVMNSLASGALTGDPSPYLSFTNIIIGYVLTLFYSVIPNLNWYTIYMLSSLFIGYSTIQYSFFKLKGDTPIRIMRHLLVLTVLLDSMVISGFTRVSTIVGLAGFLVIFLCQGKQKKELIFGVVLLFLASLIRHHVFLMLLLLSFPFLFILIYKKKYIKVLFIGAAILLSLGAQQVDRYMYKSNQEFNEFQKYRNITANLYKANKPTYTHENRANNQEDAEDWSEVEIELEELGLLHMNSDSLKTKDYSELLGVKRSVVDKIFDKRIISEFKKVYKRIWSYINDRYYYFAIIFILFLLLLGRRPKLLFSLLLYGGYILFVAFFLQYFFEGVLKNRVLVGMLTPFVLLGTYMLDRNGEIPENMLFLSGMRKESAVMLLLNIVLITIFITGYQFKTRSYSTYNKRDRAHNYQIFLAEQDMEFYVRRVGNNPYYIYKNPYDQSNSFRLGWLTYSPANKDKIGKYTGKREQSIYEILNKDVVWFFGPFRLKRDLSSIFNYYKATNKNNFYKRNVLRTNNGYPLYKYTFYNAVPDSSDFTFHHIDTALFNAPDSTYTKMVDPEFNLDENIDLEVDEGDNLDEYSDGDLDANPDNE
jgi:hypothetical protein